jgi:hypothetical protein
MEVGDGQHVLTVFSTVHRVLVRHDLARLDIPPAASPT